MIHVISENWSILLLFVIVIMTGLLLFCIKFFNYKFCQKIMSMAVTNNVIDDMDAYDMLENYKYSVILIGFITGLCCALILIFGIFVYVNAVRNLLIILSIIVLSLIGIHVCSDCKNLILLHNDISHRTKIKKIKALIKS